MIGRRLLATLVALDTIGIPATWVLTASPIVSWTRQMSLSAESDTPRRPRHRPWAPGRVTSY